MRCALTPVARPLRRPRFRLEARARHGYNKSGFVQVFLLAGSLPMWRGAILGLLLGPGALGVAQGQDAVDLQQALALQRVMQRVIAQVEPSIACVLVSRSDAYQRLGQRPGSDVPGRLGTFDPGSLPKISSEDQIHLRRKLDLADPAHVPQAFGSGVVVDASGLILTNYHVVVEATKIYVRLPGGKAGYADIHAADPRSDLAVLKLLNPKALPLTPLAPGEADRVERGQFVLSIANPFAAGFRDGQPSASWGILSNVRRRAGGPPREEERTKPLYHYGTLLQTDARLHLGCSGGALVNLDGELIGLTTAIAALQGGETPGGFALPMNAGMRRIVEVLKRGEEVEYGFLGINFDEKTGDHGGGLPVTYVAPGSPADREGRLRHGDVIVSIDQAPIRDSDDLFVHLGTRLASSRVRLQILRAGKYPATVDIALAKLHVPGKKIASSLGNRPFARGLRVDYTSLLVQPVRYGPIPAGVLITDVQPGSAADRAQLKVGEVITHVQQRPVPTPEAFYQALAAAPPVLELMLHSNAPQSPGARVLVK
jgi:serine protease Do